MLSLRSLAFILASAIRRARTLSCAALHRFPDRINGRKRRKVATNNPMKIAATAPTCNLQRTVYIFLHLPGSDRTSRRCPARKTINADSGNCRAACPAETDRISCHDRNPAERMCSTRRAGGMRIRGAGIYIKDAGSRPILCIPRFGGGVCGSEERLRSWMRRTAGFGLRSVGPAAASFAERSNPMMDLPDCLTWKTRIDLD